MKNMVMPESSYSVGWSADNQPINSYASGWTTSSNTVFESFEGSAMANGVMGNTNGLRWERKVYSMTPNQNLPILLIKDNFSGSTPTQSKFMALHLVAGGGVSTPAGSITPSPRLETSKTGTPNALPSTSRIIDLGIGVNKFTFTGQRWPQHPTGGVDWDLYSIADESQQAVIGNWGR